MSLVLFVLPQAVAGISKLAVYPCHTRLFIDFSKGKEAASRGL
jgi:uncharacterized protein (DUF2342 family)